MKVRCLEEQLQEKVLIEIIIEKKSFSINKKNVKYQKILFIQNWEAL